MFLQEGVQAHNGQGGNDDDGVLHDLSDLLSGVFAGFCATGAVTGCVTGRVGVGNQDVTEDQGQGLQFFLGQVKVENKGALLSGCAKEWLEGLLSQSRLLRLIH